MRLTSISPGSVLGCDLGSGHWTITVAPALSFTRPALAIKLRIPPSIPFLISPVSGQPVPLAEYHTMTVASAAVDLAESLEDLKPIANVATSQGSLEADLKRTTEAMTMFRNKPRVKEETLERDTKGALAIVTGYWQIIDWLRQAGRQRAELVISDATVVLEP